MIRFLLIVFINFIHFKKSKYECTLDKRSEGDDLKLSQRRRSCIWC